MWYTVDDPLAIQALTYNFLPSWWVHNYGLSFGERIVFEPDHRLEMHRFMERTVFERFPDLHIGSADPPLRGVLPDFGNAITAAAAGCEVVYPPDNYPWSHHLPTDRIPRLEVPQDISAIFPYCEIKSQVEYLRRKLEQDFPASLNTRGVLNDAMLIGGPDFFANLAEGDPITQKLIEYSAGMMRATIDFNYQRWNFPWFTFLANCVVMMVSPEMYRKQFLAYDLAFEKQVAGYHASFGIHHCGNFDHYARVYRHIPRLDWIEIGWGSDPLLALELFPEATVQCVLSAVFVASSTRVEVHTRIMEILERALGYWDRLRLSMPDVEYGTPDENLVEIYTCCKTAKE